RFLVDAVLNALEMVVEPPRLNRRKIDLHRPSEVQITVHPIAVREAWHTMAPWADDEMLPLSRRLRARLRAHAHEVDLRLLTEIVVPARDVQRGHVHLRI